MPTFFKKRKRYLIITLSLVFTIVCLIIANYLSLLVIKTNNNATTLKSNSFELYFLCLGKSQVESESKTIAKDFQNIGAGGYVWKNENYYYVVSSVYANKNDATLVQNSIKTNQNIDSEIISIDFNNIELSGTFNNDESKILTKSLNIFQEFYLNIYDIAISLDTCVYNEISARLAVSNNHNALSTLLANYEIIFQEKMTGDVKIIYDYLIQANQISQSLCSGTLVSTNQTYSSLLKYRYTEMLALYKSFSS